MTGDGRVTLLMITAVACGGTDAPWDAPPRPAAEAGAFVPRSHPDPDDAPPAPERWRVLAMQAHEEWGFAREGGLLALSLLEGAELELVGSRVVVFVRGNRIASGALLQRGDAVGVVLDDATAMWLAGDLGAERSGRRSLSNRWATFTLERTVEADPRVKLCAREVPGGHRLIGTLARRVTCEAQETEVSPTGEAVATP